MLCRALLLLQDQAAAPVPQGSCSSQSALPPVAAEVLTQGCTADKVQPPPSPLTAEESPPAPPAAVAEGMVVQSAAGSKGMAMEVEGASSAATTLAAAPTAVPLTAAQTAAPASAARANEGAAAASLNAAGARVNTGAGTPFPVAAEAAAGGVHHSKGTLGAGNSAEAVDGAAIPTAMASASAAAVEAIKATASSLSDAAPAVPPVAAPLAAAPVPAALVAPAERMTMTFPGTVVQTAAPRIPTPPPTGAAPAPSGAAAAAYTKLLPALPAVVKEAATAVGSGIGPIVPCLLLPMSAVMLQDAAARSQRILQQLDLPELQLQRPTAQGIRGSSTAAAAAAVAGLAGQGHHQPRGGYEIPTARGMPLPWTPPAASVTAAGGGGGGDWSAGSAALAARSAAIAATIAPAASAVSFGFLPPSLGGVTTLPLPIDSTRFSHSHLNYSSAPTTTGPLSYRPSSSYGQLPLSVPVKSEVLLPNRVTYQLPCTPPAAAATSRTAVAGYSAAAGASDAGDVLPGAAGFNPSSTSWSLAQGLVSQAAASASAQGLGGRSTGMDVAMGGGGRTLNGREREEGFESMMYGSRSGIGAADAADFGTGYGDLGRATLFGRGNSHVYPNPGSSSSALAYSQAPIKQEQQQQQLFPPASSWQPALVTEALGMLKPQLPPSRSEGELLGLSSRSWSTAQEPPALLPWPSQAAHQQHHWH